jgi:DNA polymerase I-like protein with 3'-5' exonuclease and polymerase domains
MNYIICKNKSFFQSIGDFNYCNLEDMFLTETLAIDTETTGLFPRNSDVFCVQLGTGRDNYLIVMYNDNYNFTDIIPYIKNKTLIFHNALFDLGFCYKHNFYPKKIRDTMLATKILYNGDIDNIKADFGSVMSRELNVTYDKTDQKNIHIVKLSQQSTIDYSFNDVDRLIELHDVLSKKIDIGGFRDTYDLHCRYIRALAYMEQCGLPISSESWKNKMKEDVIETNKWKLIIEEYIYDNIPKFADRQIDMFDTNKKITISINSPIQMLKVFKALNIPTKDKDGKDSINDNIISKSKHEFVEMWLNYQKANHRVTTFGDKIYQKIENERIYTTFNPMVDTARLSTRKGNINFLNFPSDKVTRNCFKANTGNVMIVCDYSGQETVIAADLSEDEAMTASVVDGVDLHSAFARVLFPELKDLSDEEIINNYKSFRQAAKSPRFAFQYGGSAYTIHQNEGIPLDRCYEIENAFKELHKGLYTWGAEEFNKAISKGYIESVDGWKLKLPNFKLYKQYEEKVKNITKDQWQIYKQGKIEYKKRKEALEKKQKHTPEFTESLNFFKSKKEEVSKFFKLKSSYQRLCLNNPVQSEGAAMLKRSSCLLFEWIEENNLINKVRIVNSIHDEIVLEVSKEIKNLVCKKLGQFMEEGGNYYLKKLKIKAEASIGETWYDAK